MAQTVPGRHNIQMTYFGFLDIEEHIDFPEKHPSLQMRRKQKRPDIELCYLPVIAENGSYYGEISKTTGRPKYKFIKGYYRKTGVYVRSHYRS